MMCLWVPDLALSLPPPCRTHCVLSLCFQIRSIVIVCVCVCAVENRQHKCYKSRESGRNTQYWSERMREREREREKVGLQTGSRRYHKLQQTCQVFLINRTRR